MPDAPSAATLPSTAPTVSDDVSDEDLLKAFEVILVFGGHYGVDPSVVDIARKAVLKRFSKLRAALAIHEIANGSVVVSPADEQTIADILKGT